MFGKGSRATGPALGALYAGLVLTVVATAVPYVDHATADLLSAHIRDGYPAYGPAKIETAATLYLVVLSTVGALGVAGWLATILAVRAGRRWARAAATAMFAAGTTIALTDLLIKDTSGDTGLAPLEGWAGMAPCVAGLLAVVLLWRAPGTAVRPRQVSRT